MKIRKSTYNRIISRAANILKEDMRGGVDMLNWNELQVGDLVDVDGDYNHYSKVRITQKLEDVSRESSLPPGPGFIGYSTDRGFGEKEEFVFSIQDVDISSYQKYAFAEARRLKSILKLLIKEQNQQL